MRRDTRSRHVLAQVRLARRDPDHLRSQCQAPDERAGRAVEHGDRNTRGAARAGPALEGSTALPYHRTWAHRRSVAANLSLVATSRCRYAVEEGKCVTAAIVCLTWE